MAAKPKTREVTVWELLSVTNIVTFPPIPQGQRGLTQAQSRWYKIILDLFELTDEEAEEYGIQYQPNGSVTMNMKKADVICKTVTFPSTRLYKHLKAAIEAYEGWVPIHADRMDTLMCKFGIKVIEDWMDDEDEDDEEAKG